MPLKQQYRSIPSKCSLDASGVYRGQNVEQVSVVRSEAGRPFAGYVNPIGTDDQLENSSYPIVLGFSLGPNLQQNAGT